MGEQRLTLAAFPDGWDAAGGEHRSSAVRALARADAEAGAGAGCGEASGERRPFSTVRSCSQSTSGRAGMTASTDGVV